MLFPSTVFHTFLFYTKFVHTVNVWYLVWFCHLPTKSYFHGQNLLPFSPKFSKIASIDPSTRLSLNNTTVPGGLQFWVICNAALQVLRRLPTHCVGVAAGTGLWVLNVSKTKKGIFTAEACCWWKSKWFCAMVGKQLTNVSQHAPLRISTLILSELLKSPLNVLRLRRYLIRECFSISAWQGPGPGPQNW